MESPEGATEEDVRSQQTSDSGDLTKPTDFVQTTEPAKTNRRPLKSKVCTLPYFKTGVFKEFLF